MRLITSIRKRLTRIRKFPCLGRHDDGIFVLDPKNWIDNRVLAKADYETNQIQFARKVIHERNLNLVVDVGANFGIYSILLGLINTVDRVYAFEPVKRNYNQLCGNVFINRLDHKVVCHRNALGESSQISQIHIDSESTGVSRIDLNTTKRSKDVFQEREEIHIIRGDDIIFDQNCAVFVKIDVEGYGLNVIRGLESFLSRNHGVLQLEADIDISDCTTLLNKHGWSFLKKIDGDQYFQKTK